MKGILCASENLYDFQKAFMTETFQCRVFSHYGHYELAALAGYCERSDAYHVLPQYGCVELLDEQGQPVTTPGATGEIVATSLLMTATGFFRYRTRDFAIYQGNTCPDCGRPLQLWSGIEGRLQDFFVTGRHRRISIAAINMHDHIFDDIYQFQYVQDIPGKVSLKYVPKPSFNQASEERIRAGLMPKFGDDMELSFQKVDEKDITRSKRGKFLFLDQKLKLENADVRYTDA